MTTVNPTQPVQTLRSTRRTCHQLGVCLHPERACLNKCVNAMQLLAPGVVDGPYTSHHSRSERLSRIVVLGACIAAAIVVLLKIAGYL